ATLVGKDRGQGGRLPMVRMILYGNSDEKTADRAIGFSFFFRQYLVDFGGPIDGSLFAGEAVDCFGLATPNNFHHPAKSGIAFSHFENGWLRHLANIRLCGTGVQAAIQCPVVDKPCHRAKRALHQASVDLTQISRRL
ncbi:MAG: hypothetical protein WA615_18005, partial [Bradyrhizobium sp.]|uniref:hypothetical protein n=1 Tax=Bradyrhizobium sp. TaxID=376 RepID=UPI003C7D9E2C